jgi:hypothetical protein
MVRFLCYHFPGRQFSTICIESSILIAMRSRLYPSSNATPPSFNTMDLGLSLDISQPSAPDPVPSVEWEAWGEEATIELCEVQLGFDGSSISMDALFFNLTVLFMISCRYFYKSTGSVTSHFWTTIKPTLVCLHPTTSIVRLRSDKVTALNEDQETIKTDRRDPGSGARSNLFGC